jgi:hypothetical protein
MLPPRQKFHHAAPRHKISSSCCPQTQNFVIMLPPNTKFNPNAQFLPSAAHYQKSSSATVCYSLPKVLPCHQRTFSRRTSGHCLAAYKAAIFWLTLRGGGDDDDDDVNNKCIASRRHSPTFLLPTLSLSLCVSLQIVTINTTCYLKTTNAITQTPVCLSALSLQGTN